MLRLRPRDAVFAVLEARPCRMAVAFVALLALMPGCGNRHSAPPLEKTNDEDVAIPDVPVPPENGPRIGAITNVATVFDRPSKHGKTLGYLHAGETVARAAQPFSTRGCDGGWYPIRPRGFLCASDGATTDLAHPTLAAMSIHADLAASLPYTYARAVRDTELFEPDSSRDRAVRPLGELRAKSGLAVVGSWSAIDDKGKERRLAMMTDGRFVPAEDLESQTEDAFRGIALEGDVKLPIAFVVKRGVHAWKMRGDEPEKEKALDYHARIDLTGKHRTVSGIELWSTNDDRWVRLRDVTLVRERSDFPTFATDDQRWLDVSIVTGTLVAYEGKKAVFATLVSVGKDRLGAEGANVVTTRGEHRVVGKHVTLAGHDPSTLADGVSIFDAPWALELSSGQFVLGAYWHDRFGIEHGPGNIEVSPADAARLFRFSTPDLPPGFHAVTADAQGEHATIVNVRK